MGLKKWSWYHDGTTVLVKSTVGAFALKPFRVFSWENINWKEIMCFVRIGTCWPGEKEVHATPTIQDLGASGTYGVLFKISDGHPHQFYMGVPHLTHSPPIYCINATSLKIERELNVVHLSFKESREKIFCHHDTSIKEHSPLWFLQQLVEWERSAWATTAD